MHTKAEKSSETKKVAMAILIEKIKLSLILNKYLTFKLHNLTLLMTIKIKRAI